MPEQQDLRALAEESLRLAEKATPGPWYQTPHTLAGSVVWVSVRGGRLAYLSARPNPQIGLVTISGVKALRALAKAILKEIPKEKRRGK